MKLSEALSLKPQLSLPAGQFIPLVGALCVLYLGAVLLFLEGYWLGIAAAAGLAGVVALLLLRPAVCLLLVFAYLPFQALLTDIFARFSSLVAIGKDVLMALMVVSLVGHHLLRKRAWYINTTMYWLFGFILMASLAAATSPEPLHGFLGLRFLGLYPAIIVLAANALESEADIRRMLRLLAVVGAITVVYGILQYLTQFDVPYRISGGDVKLRMGRFDEMAIVSTFASRPMFGGWLVPLFLLFLHVNLQESGRVWRRLRLLLLGAILGCALLTYSRSTWLAFLVSTLVTVWLKDKMKAAFAVVMLLLALALFVATKSFLLPASVSDAATDSESFEERLSYWPMVFRHVVEHPLGLGLGMVGGPHLFEDAAQTDAYGNLQYDQFAMFDPQGGLGPDNKLMVTDNTFLKLMVQGGIPLLIPFLGMLISVIRMLSSMYRQARDPWVRSLLLWGAGSLAGMFSIFMFVDFLETGPAIALYWLMIGILCCLRKLSQEGRAEARRPGSQPLTV